MDGGPLAGMAAAGPGVVWLAAWSGRTLTGIDPGSGHVERRIRLPRGIAGIAVGGSTLWVALYGRRPDEGAGRRRGPSALLVLDAATGRRTAAPRTFRGRPWQLAADGRGAWVRAGYRVLLGWDARHRAPRAGARHRRRRGARARPAGGVGAGLRPGAACSGSTAGTGPSAPWRRTSASSPPAVVTAAGSVWVADLMSAPGAADRPGDGRHDGQDHAAAS